MSAITDHAVDVLIGLVITSLIGVLVWAAKRWLQDEIERATYPIQKHANGGLSLPDVAKAAAETKQDVRDMRETQLEIHAILGEIRGGFAAHLVNHAK